MDFDLGKFFTFSIDMLCIAGFDGYFKHINPSFERNLGWTSEELLSRPFVDYVHPDDVVATLLELEKLSKGNATVSFENRYRRKDDSHCYMLWTAYPDMETGLVYSVARDITERKIVEQAREKKLQAVLEDLQKLQSLIPICSYCKNIRNDEGYWRKIELYLEEHTDIRLTHSVCPNCADKHFGEYLAKRNLV